MMGDKRCEDFHNLARRRRGAKVRKGETPCLPDSSLRLCALACDVLKLFAPRPSHAGASPPSSKPASNLGPQGRTALILLRTRQTYAGAVPASRHQHHTVVQQGRFVAVRARCDPSPEGFGPPPVRGPLDFCALRRLAASSRNTGRKHACLRMLLHPLLLRYQFKLNRLPPRVQRNQDMKSAASSRLASTLHNCWV